MEIQLSELATLSNLKLACLLAPLVSKRRGRGGFSRMLVRAAPNANNHARSRQQREEKKGGA